MSYYEEINDYLIRQVISDILSNNINRKILKKEILKDAEFLKELWSDINNSIKDIDSNEEDYFEVIR